jgi:hypothetical protein
MDNIMGLRETKVRKRQRPVLKLTRKTKSTRKIKSRTHDPNDFSEAKKMYAENFDQFVKKFLKESR